MTRRWRALRRVFGIVGICPVVILEDQGFEQSGKVRRFLSEGALWRRLRARPSRFTPRGARKTYPMASMEMNAELGGRILDAFPKMKVDVHEPELMLHIEVREKIYLYSDVIPGLGGMPHRDERGKLHVAALRRRIDSPVAGYMVARSAA